MSNTPETLAAILAEMRGNEFDDPHLDADGIIGARRLARDWADRIEAAVERRVKEAKDGIWRNAEEIHDIHCNDCTFRAALVEILDWTNKEKARNYKAALDGGILEIHDTALHETKGE